MTSSIPGAGQLSHEQRVLVARSLRLAPIEADTLMVKVLRPGAAGRYLGREVSAGMPGVKPPFHHKLVGGSVSRQQDTTHLRTPVEFVASFRLDFPANAFGAQPSNVQVMEFLAVDPDRFVLPLGAPTLPYPRTGYPENHARVEVAAMDMVAAAREAGIDLDTFRQELNPWPYTGTGITANSELGFPEYWMRFGVVPGGAMIFDYNHQGQKNPVAVYRGAALGWVRA
ncbi:hypothetical protein [Amycolatopsis sp. NPDC059657]|uniref:hypothetical protein n=1 Tax=Amycolatopsis sp. NPDC059657 TaxID=3346899 RepID=UPI00366BF17D